MKKVLILLKRKSVLYPNERAYTLVEMLFALSIFMVIIFFISPVFHLIVNNNEHEISLQAMEWDVFCSQVKKEIHASHKAEIISAKLVLTMDTDTVIYEKYGNSLRRRVNYSGHEILLQNVSQVTFTLLNNSVKIAVNDLRGKEYFVTIQSFLEWDNAV